VIFAEKPIKKYPRIVKLCEFAPSERALFTQRRKEAYEALHPETKHGAIGRGHEQSRQLGDSEKADRFTADTAARTGQSERSVQRDATRGGNASGTAWRWDGQSRRPRAGFRDHDAENHMPVAGRSIRHRTPPEGRSCAGQVPSRMRPHAGFPDQRLFHAHNTWIDRYFAHKPHCEHELAPLDPKNRRKPQGTASGLRFFRAADSTIYLQFS